MLHPINLNEKCKLPVMPTAVRIVSVETMTYNKEKKRERELNDQWK